MNGGTVSSENKSPLTLLRHPANVSGLLFISLTIRTCPYLFSEYFFLLISSYFPVVVGTETNQIMSF